MTATRAAGARVGSAANLAATVSSPLLRVAHLSKSFGGVAALHDVSFDLHAGEMLALIGPNGAGKTTCFNIVNGQLKPDSGSVTLDRTELVGLRADAIWRLGVGRTFQIAETFASLTVVENVQLALLSHAGRVLRGWRAARSQFRDDALALLASVGMQAQAERATSVLAYGDVKRVELALALANAPRLLLMDEPTAGMGAAERNALMALTRELARERGIGVLFTEHSMDVVFGHADRVIVLARGELIGEGAPAVVRDAAQVRAVYFGGGSTFEARPVGGGRADATASAADAVARSDAPGAALDAGAAASAGPVAASPPAPALLEVERLDAWYGKARILDGVALRVGRGECVALMGRNGAGKSTTLKSIMGLVARRSGRVVWQGRDIIALPAHRISRLGLGWVPEDRRIFTDLTVRENLAIARQPQRDGAPHWTEAQVFELFPNLAAMAGRLGGRLSGGEQQMLTIGRTLMGNPQLLLLDEPSEGVAPLVVEQIAQMIVALKRQGLAILLSEQNIRFTRLIADRVVVLEKGEVRYAGPMASLAADEAVQRRYLGI